MEYWTTTALSTLIARGEMESASSPLPKPSSGPPFARGDNKMTNRRKKTCDKQQRQLNVSAGSSIKKSSSGLSSPSRFPVLAPPRSQQRLFPATKESAVSSRRRAWPALATTTGTRNKTSTSMIGSSASTDHSCSSGSALRKKLSQRCCHHSDIGEKGNAPPSETASSTIRSKYRSNVSPTMMEQCLAILSQGTSHDNTTRDHSASSSSGPPTSTSDREIYDESKGFFTDDEEASCAIHGDVDDLLTRPPPRLEDMTPAGAGDECDGENAVSAPESSSGEETTTLRRDRGDRSFPKISLRGADITGASNGDKYGGDGGSAGGREMSRGDIGQSGTLARENVTTRPTNIPSADSDKSGSKTDRVSRSLRQRRRSDKPVMARNRLGLRRRDRVDAWPSPAAQHVVNGGMPDDHSSNCRRHPAAGFVKDFDGIDTALVAEAFAFADRIARHETEEEELVTADFLRTTSDAHLNKAGQKTATATSAGFPMPSYQRYKTQRGRLRRAKSTGATTMNTSKFSFDTKGRRNKKWVCKPVASAVRLGDKYDSSSVSLFADDWRRGMTGGIETHDQTTCSVERHVELGSRMDKALGAQSDGRGSVNEIDTFLGSKVDINLAPRSTVVSAAVAATREEAAKAKIGLRMAAHHYLSLHRRGHQQQHHDSGRKNHQLVSSQYDSGNGTIDDSGSSRRVQLEAKRASMKAELVKRGVESRICKQSLRPVMLQCGGLLRRSDRQPADGGGHVRYPSKNYHE